MHLGTRLRRILAMMTVLISLLAGLGVASAQEDAPIPSGEGGRQTPRAADGTSASLHSNATDTPLSSPSPIQTTTPLSPTPSTLSSTAGTPDSTAPAPAESADKTEDQASHTVLFDPADSSKPTHASVKTGTLAAAPQQNPQREGFRFEGWTLDGRPYDFQTPVLQDTTLKARWTKVTDWTLSPDHGPATGARLTISPPDRQEPQIASIQAAGNQIAGLTGDGRIYTWTQDSTPVQFPLPTHAADGFRYLQAAAGSHRQAALGSDQRIYTWNSGQATPTILDTGQDTKFTSIGMNDNRLLAVDQQGQAHAYQTRDAGSQEPNPKFTKQAETSLPGKAQAVTAIASPGRILIVDADGQAWTWETANTGSAKPARIKQDPGMRIIQAHALNQGFLLLDTERRIRYLADNTTSPTAVNLPANIKTNSITANDSQAVITDTEGHVWSWQPGEAPMRADDGNKRYMQAASTGSRITAIDRQGSMFTWDVDGQGQPGKPARVSTTTASILESASLNGQPLNLTKNNDAWQTDMPASKPGPTTVLIVGRQDGQPFTKNLNYTVDQPLTRGAEPRSTFTVHFDTGGGNPEPADQNVSTPNGRVKRPSPDPAREGYLFDGWFTGEVAYDFSKPVTKSLTLTARWTFKDPDNTWKINPDQGSRLGNETTTITPPDTSRGIRFTQVSGSMYDSSISYGFSLAVGSDGNAWAWGSNYYGQLGIDKPDQRNTPAPVPKPADTPMDFTYVQVSAGSRHSLALGSDGNAYAWGENSKGQIGDGTDNTSPRTTPVKVKKPAGTPADFTYTQVSGGAYHSLALGSDGNAYAWGHNYSGQIGDGTTTRRTTPVKVKKPAGTPADFTYTQVSAGVYYSLALGSDGNAYAWGENDKGQIGDGTTTRRTTPVKVMSPADTPADFTYTQVSAGGYHALAVGSDGNAYAWGYNDTGQIGDGTTTRRTTPVKVMSPADTPADFTYTQVSGGNNYSLAVGSDGNAYAWGSNQKGVLGINIAIWWGDTNPAPMRVRDPSSPKDKSKGLQAEQVSAGYQHSLAVGSDGNAYAWGDNENGQLGNDSIPTGQYNSKAQNPAPVPVSFNLQLVITGVRFDQTPASGLTRGDGSSVTVTTSAHAPGTVTVNVDYTLGGAPKTPDTSLQYTYLPAGVLPNAGGEGILLALATGMTGMGGVLASRRHRRETHSLSLASHG
ncbi:MULTISPECIES: RCC1 domain-containing protein [Bifidobacterium]|uniref:Chromosome condensation regulator RCC1 n=2 Tax=Bifidobacterium TaxID=1678 RepID=A0A556RCN8_9BIFI|nr:MULTISPECIES: InlB B-repeat-containing protein [Bifidobacterium]MBI0063402.1 InlB B-repeat-containing protein [Bifidobacterium polysaccharolyticum]MBI0085878.1 InlB B-repeat-containing protein [Bifidobacterium sp. M0404]MBI0106240.1 InlB B-repeat-containing protein [Bifidobacterium polysaccharolyticum]TSJ86654.1 chromosome condensation regulator RCC1 [Bifidobacterium polysaccharolyticum]